MVSLVGMKVIIDFIPNQTSDRHRWFNRSRASSDPKTNPFWNFYVWAKCDGPHSPPNNWVRVALSSQQLGTCCTLLPTTRYVLHSPPNNWVRVALSSQQLGTCCTLLPTTRYVLHSPHNNWVRVALSSQQLGTCCIWLQIPLWRLHVNTTTLLLYYPQHSLESPSSGCGATVCRTHLGWIQTVLFVVTNKSELYEFVRCNSTQLWLYWHHYHIENLNHAKLYYSVISRQWHWLVTPIQNGVDKIQTTLRATISSRRVHEGVG